MSSSISTSTVDLRRNLFVHRSIRSYKQNRPKRRAVLKNGDFFTIESQKKKNQFQLIQSVFIALVHMKLSRTLLIFLITLLSSWLMFAVLWWLICYSHGDFEENHLPPHQKTFNFSPCIHEVYGFASCFLFSIETQHTVGYGIRATTEECPEAIFVNAVQCNVGTILQGIMSGIIFTKLTLPNKRAKTVMFSKSAVISLRDGFYQLMFRVGDIRYNHIIEIKVKAFLMRTVRTIEGELIKLHETPLEMKIDDCKKDFPLMWPVIVAHKIDSKSPLWGITPQQLIRDTFEIIVVLEGSIESTGQSMQARTSYLPSEILWGCDFKPLLKFNKFLCEYEVDYSNFESVTLAGNMMPQNSSIVIEEKDPSTLEEVENGSVEEAFINEQSS